MVNKITIEPLSEVLLLPEQRERPHKVYTQSTKNTVKWTRVSLTPYSVGVKIQWEKVNVSARGNARCAIEDA